MAEDPAFSPASRRSASWPAWFRQAPRWFRDAVATPWEERWVTVGGIRVRYQRWVGKGPGAGRRPGIVLIHGGSAHAHWWDFIAPQMLDEHQCVALDLGGHGDTDHRESYAMEHVDEVAAVIADAALPPRPAAVGHSFGGWVALAVAKHRPGLLGGVVVVDSPMRPASQAGQGGPPAHLVNRSMDHKHREYPTYTDAINRFRLQPPQDCPNPFIVKYIAHHSVRQTPRDTWIWKVDPLRFPKSRGKGKGVGQRAAEGEFNDGVGRVAFIYGSESALVSPQVLRYMRQLDGWASASFTCVREACHHLTLDQPLAFVACLSAILGEWRRQDAAQGAGAAPSRPRL